MRDYFNPDLGLDDIKWEAFGTPEWAPDRIEMWPTDYVSLVLTGRASQAAIAEKFSRQSMPSAAATPNAVRPGLSTSMKTLMKRIVTNNKIPGNVQCRELAQAPNKYESGFACTDGDEVLHFLLIESYTN